MRVVEGLVRELAMHSWSEFTRGRFKIRMQVPVEKCLQECLVNAKRLSPGQVLRYQPHGRYHGHGLSLQGSRQVVRQPGQSHLLRQFSGTRYDDQF